MYISRSLFALTPIALLIQMEWTVDGHAKEGERGPWFGYEPKLVPFSTVQKTDDSAKQKAAKGHLAKAIERFKEAIKLAPDNLPARLGYAWTLEQSGATNEAVKEYRAMIEDAWKKEKDLNSSSWAGTPALPRRLATSSRRCRGDSIA